MERYEKQPPADIPTEKVLQYASEERLLELCVDGSIVERSIRETGEYQDHVVTVGEQTMSFRMPVSKLVEGSRYESLQDFATACRKKDVVNDQYRHVELDPTIIENESYIEWVRQLSIPGVDELVQAARTIEVSSGQYATETLPCSNCKGNRIMRYSCQCTQGGSSIYDAESGETVRERPIGEVLSDCNTCHGTGQASNDCPICHGTGEREKYPSIVLTNEKTLETRVIILDVAALIRETPDLVLKSEFIVEQSWLGLSANARMQFTPLHLVQKIAEDMGVPAENAMIVAESGHLGRLGDYFQQFSIATEQWNDKNGSRKNNRRSATASADEPGAPAEYITQLQAAISWQYGANRASDGDITRARHYQLREVSTFDQSLNDLKLALSEKGYSLVFGYSGIATGEVGPTFYAATVDGQVAGQLSQDYDMRAALEQALVRVRMME